MAVRCSVWRAVGIVGGLVAEAWAIPPDGLPIARCVAVAGPERCACSAETVEALLPPEAYLDVLRGWRRAGALTRAELSALAAEMDGACGAGDAPGGDVRSVRAERGR